MKKLLFLCLICIEVFYPKTFLYSQNTPIRFGYIGQYDNRGKPDYLENNDIIDQNFQNDVFAALPERSSVPSNNPAFVTRDNEADISLTGTADVWITFVHESTNKKNVLGYYTYPTNNPPRNISDIRNRTILFPNVNFENGGGALSSGNKIYLGKFDANTSIGWFVLVDGFMNGKVIQSNIVLYSEASFNPENDGLLKSHTVLINDARNKRIILGFEDDLRDRNSDHDFNDMIFYITANPATAVNTSNIPLLRGGGNRPANPNRDIDRDNKQNPNNPPPDDKVKIDPVTTPPPAPTNLVVLTEDPTVCARDGITAENFKNLKNAIRSQTVESNKPLVIKQAVKTKKVTVAQVKEIIKLILIEQYKLDMAKFLFEYTCDKSNYFQINSLLNASRVRELNDFLKDKNMSDETASNVAVNNTNSSATKCVMPEEDFESIKESIKSKSFSSDMMSVLKLAMPGRCIQSDQVSELMDLFSFENDKLTAAKFLYSYTSDKENYFKVGDKFSFSGTRNELKNFINNNR